MIDRNFLYELITRLAKNARTPLQKYDTPHFANSNWSQEKHDFTSILSFKMCKEYLKEMLVRLHKTNSFKTRHTLNYIFVYHKH